jgi:hypothetical protein
VDFRARSSLTLGGQSDSGVGVWVFRLRTGVVRFQLQGGGKEQYVCPQPRTQKGPDPGERGNNEIMKKGYMNWRKDGRQRDTENIAG